MGDGNLVIWEQVARPPAAAMKPIIGGKLKGKSNIDPMWRILQATKVWGPAGGNWGYRHKEFRLDTGSEGEVVVTAIGYIFYLGESGEERIVFAVGSSLLMESTKHGLKTNDEAFKMAMTDAMSVGLKQLGFGADVYMGQFDGSKYTVESLADMKHKKLNPKPAHKTEPRIAVSPEPEEPKVNHMTPELKKAKSAPKQKPKPTNGNDVHKRLGGILRKLGYTNQQAICASVAARSGENIEHPKQITDDIAQAVLPFYCNLEQMLDALSLVGCRGRADQLTYVNSCLKSMEQDPINSFEEMLPAHFVEIERNYIQGVENE